MKALFLAGVLHLLLAVTSVSANTEITTGQSWNVLLITVDNLRPDRMSVYGYPEETTPYLSEFAQESAVFANAFSTSAWTAPGVVSLLTGYYPPVHAQHGRFSFYDETMTAALRLLAARGYEIRGQSIWGASHAGFGFQNALGNWPRRKLEDFIEIQAANPTSFFAWAHLTDVHLPYNPTEKNVRRFGAGEYTSPAIEAVKKHRVIFRYPEQVDVDMDHPGKIEFSNADIRIVKALYDGEVADVDERLRNSLERMRVTGLLDKTIVIISADHGEELFDHGWLGHASTGYDAKLYDELVRIPLIIRLPDQSLRGRFDALVQGVDLMPTIFELLGINGDDMQPRMQGKSLLPVMRGETREIREFVFGQTTLKGWTTPREEMDRRLVSVRSRDKKLILVPTAEGTDFEAYDLRLDPGEQSNVYRERKNDFEALETALQDWMLDNRARAASLVTGAGETRLDGIAGALLNPGDLEAAVDHWISIQTTEKTWDLEPDSIFDHELHNRHWETIQRTAAGMIGQAMRCVSENGILRTGDETNPRNLDTWYCEKHR